MQILLQDAVEKNLEITAQATSVMEERDDEIKQLNNAIHNAKCHAIRDKQVLEKEEMNRHLQEEEARLNHLMEMQRQKDMQEQEQREMKKQLQRLKGAQMIQEQIKTKEQQRLLDAERKDQETHALLYHLDTMQQEEMDNVRKKKDAQRSLMADVAHCSDVS